MNRLERECPRCGVPLPYGSLCVSCEAQMPHCSNCGDLLRVPHWELPTGRCTTVEPQEAQEQEEAQMTFDLPVPEPDGTAP